MYETLWCNDKLKERAQDPTAALSAVRKPSNFNAIITV